MNSQPQNSYPSYFDSGEEESIDLKRYLSLFISNWYLFGISLLITLSVAYGINRWSEKVYTVSSTLLIKDDKFAGSTSDLANIFPGTNAFRSQQNLKNEIGILKSFNLNYQVMQRLPEFNINYVQVGKRGIAETRLYKNCPFEVKYESLSDQKLKQRVDITIISDQQYSIRIKGKTNFQKDLNFGDNFNDLGFNFKINLRNNFKFDPNTSNKYYFYFISPVELANSYRGKLAVFPIAEEASLVTLTTSGNVSDQEADYLNMLMDVYLDFGLAFKNLTASQTIDFIENQLGTISDSLELAEKDLESFRLVYNIINISSEGEIIQRKLENADLEKKSLILQKDYYNYLKNYIESKGDSGDMVAPAIIGITDPSLIKFVEEFSRLQHERNQIRMNLHDSSEPLKTIESDIETTRRSITENVKDGFKNIDISLANADERLKLIESEIKKLPSTERQMINIQRKFDINNTVYTFLLEKRAEAGIAKASNVPDNRIIDYAGYFSSTMIEPKARKNFTLAFILGLMFPLLGIILIDFLNNKIIDKKDIEKITTVPVIGFIGHNDAKTEMPVFEKPGSTLSESFRSVRTNLKYFIKDIECPVISVSSTITGEGKSFISANLASIIAMSDKKVLLLGLDLRKPRIHKIFEIDNGAGITNFLIGESKIEDIIIKTKFKNLWYTNAGPVPPNPAELIESPAMSEFIREAKKSFDYIIIDTPPVAIVTDAMLVSSFTDFYVFIVRQRYSSKKTIGLIEELHKNDNIKRIGIIINDISLAGYYGYGLRYGYSAGYGYSYGYNYYGSYSDHKYGYSDSSKGYYKES